MSYPQQGGYGPPPQGGYGPPPQGGYYPPQQGGYPGPGGYYPPPKKNNTGLIIGVGGVVLVAVIALVLVLVLTGGDDDDKKTAGDKPGNSQGIPGPNGSSDDDSGSSDSGSDSGSDEGSGGSGGSGSPEALADAVVDVIENQDADAIDDLACNAADADELKSELAKLAGLDVSASVEGVDESGDTAQATIEMQAGGQSEGFTIEMENQGGAWCASGI